MAANLFTPILNDRTRSIHFFNGRLLTGEDMTAEQRGQRATHELIAQSIGDGIVRGLEVAIDDATSLAAPVVNVTGGVAINRKGETLYLPESTRVQLVRTADAAPAARTLFTACTPPESGVYVAGAGVYLLTLCSTVAADGSASVSGLGGQPSGCNTRFAVDAVQFRLIELPMTDEEMSDIPRLRNLVAYRCFGISSSFATDPFGATAEPPTLLDELRPRSLTDCDVPLATFYWTATGGLVWADMWSVRRTIARAAGAIAPLSERRLATSEAMREQFRAQIAQTASSGSPLSLAARSTFAWLPPAGILPIAIGNARNAFTYVQFFAGMTVRPPVHIEGSTLAKVLQDSSSFPPIDVGSAEMVWLYFVRENMQAHDQGRRNQPCVVFANAGLPFYGEARFDRSHFNYSNFT